MPSSFIFSGRYSLRQKSSMRSSNSTHETPPKDNIQIRIPKPRCSTPENSRDATETRREQPTDI